MTRRQAISAAGIVVGAMALAGTAIWHLGPMGAPQAEDAAAAQAPRPQAPPGIETASRSAAAGGVTTCCDMPYDVPQPVTDAQLRAETEAFAAGIRTFENAYKLERGQIANNNSIQDAQSELDRIRTGYGERFRRDYRPRALTLRGELLRRLNRPLTPEIAAATAPADGGPLAGPSPLADMSDSLSALAAELP